MKRIFLIILSILLMSTLVFGASLNLKATWDPNVEPDMKEYRLYRTDGTRLLLGTIPHPPTLPYPFSITVVDNSQGIATFVLTAADTYGNESEDSVTFPYPFDLLRPAAPGGFKVIK